MKDLSPIERLLAIEDCKGLMVEYARRFDHGRATEVAELFTHDGAWRSNTIDAVGQGALVVFFRRRQELTERVTRHVVTNIAIQVVDPDHAKATSVAVELRDVRGSDGLAVDTRPAIVGDYEDDLVRVDGQWLFSERRVRVAFKRETETLMAPSGAEGSV